MKDKAATIHLHQAIHLMREYSARGEHFAFSFATYDRSRRICHGMMAVQRAILRPAAKGDDIRNADHKLFYFDDTQQRAKVCWQPLIMFFQGLKVTL